MQSAYLCVIFHVKHQKNLLFLAVLTWFLSFGKRARYNFESFMKRMHIIHKHSLAKQSNW